MEIPPDFGLAVQVYQVCVFLQVEECIGALHGHIRQVIRERPLESVELETVWYCLSSLAPKVYEFAVCTQYERERQVWLLGPMLGHTEQEHENARHVEEVEDSSGEETIVVADTDQDTKMILDDVSTDSDEIGFTAEDEATNRDDEGFDQEDEAADHDERRSEEDSQPIPIIHLRRRSLPTPHSKIMYDIDTSEFRECADEELEY